MQKAFDDQMNKMKELLLKDKVPWAVVDGFMSVIYHAAHRDPPYNIGNESPFVQAAIESQETLGSGIYPAGLSPYAMDWHDLKAMGSTAGPKGWQNTQI